MPAVEPQVRIGMIQSTDRIVFSVNAPFVVENLSGTTIATGVADEKYAIEIASSTSSHVVYCVRLAISDTKLDAERRLNVLMHKYSHLTLKQIGKVLSFGDIVCDNREYWIVTDPFEDLRSAQLFQQNFKPLGQAHVIQDVVEASQGEMQLAGLSISEGLRILPDKPDSRILLDNVTVGIEFHWQHQRTQELEGVLEVRFNNNGKLVAINELGVESYLASVNSSEMTAECPAELLKAQTIAARSTILATMGKHHYDEKFHLCSDDHCQCYHGAKNVTEASRRACVETWGENLMHHGRICDARYSKICGGVMEGFPYVWDDRDIPYLAPGVDGVEDIAFPLDTEEKVIEYIDSSPEVYCNTTKYKIEANLPYNSKDLFRWQVSYARDELQKLITKRTGEHFGELLDIMPVERGPSGRLVYLDIVGTERTLRIGKELVIRRALSETHLYSSCFTVGRERNASGEIIRFVLKGAGWGHGVGLCQVGATVMAQLGFNCKQILEHYYKGTELKKVY